MDFLWHCLRLMIVFNCIVKSSHGTVYIHVGIRVEYWTRVGMTQARLANTTVAGDCGAECNFCTTVGGLIIDEDMCTCFILRCLPQVSKQVLRTRGRCIIPTHLGPLCVMPRDLYQGPSRYLWPMSSVNRQGNYYYLVICPC